MIGIPLGICLVGALISIPVALWKYIDVFEPKGKEGFH